MADIGSRIILINPLIQEALSKATSFAAPGNLKQKFAELAEYLTAIQPVVKGAEEMQESDTAIRIWLQMLNDAVHEAVNALDDLQEEPKEQKEHASSSDHGHHVMETEVRSPQRRGKRGLSSYPIITGLLKAVRKPKTQEQQVHTLSPSKSKRGIDFLMNKFTTINESLAEIRKEVDFVDETIKFRKKNLPTTGPQYGTIPFVDDSQVVGRENDVVNITDSLLNLRSQHPISGVSILGMEGIGKTALARLVYNKAKEERLYDVVAWVPASEDFDDKRILSEMLEYCDSCDVHADGESTIDQLLLCLGKEFKDKTFLLILDDFCEKDASKWNVLASHLSKIVELTDGSCSIVLTTRSEHVASVTMMESSFPMHKHDTRPLTDDECWLVIEKMVLKSSSETSIRSELANIGKEIAKRCEGLPLGAVIIGGTLRSQTEISEWMAIKNNKVWLFNSSGRK